MAVYGVSRKLCGRWERNRSVCFSRKRRSCPFCGQSVAACAKKKKKIMKYIYAMKHETLASIVSIINHTV